MPDAFILTDGDYNFLYLNKPAEALMSRTREDLLGKNLLVEYPTILGTLAEREYARVLREGGTATFQLSFSEGALRLEVRAFASHGGLAIFVRDISDDYATQQRMRLLQAAVARLEDSVVITEAATPDPRILFVNAAFERLTGYTAEESLGRPPDFLRGPATDKVKLQSMREGLSRGEVVRGELVYRTKTGDDLWVDMQMAPFRAATGEATHVVVVARDIGERKRAEQALHEAVERFRIVSKVTADVVWDWNLIDDTIWWSDGMRTLFGYHEQTTPMNLWADNIHPDDAARVIGSIEAVIDGTEEKWSAEYRFKHADGSYAEVTDRGFVIRDAAGKALRMVGSMVDVTEQRQLEAQLRQSQRLEAIGQLTGGVAHDFNNLLTVILSNAELLEARLAGNDQLRMLAEMTRIAAERGADLTSRLLAFARRQTLDTKPADIAHLLKGMEPLLNRALGAHVEARIEAEPGLWRALIDPLQLESALLNLCINARDAMPDGGVLTIRATNVVLDAEGESESGDYVAIAVADTGEGMDEATRARAFEPFFTTKEVGKGSGLGLSMVYGFVTQSKGRISIDTELGKGTTITLSLPRAREPAHTSVTSDKERVLEGDERILVVEDDDLVRAQVCTELATLGYRVVSVRNAAEALETLRADTAFDLLFTDIVMPGGVNGRQLADAAQELAPQLPVLFTSGYPDIALAADGRIAPGVHLLRKPYRRRELAAKVRDALGSCAVN